MILAIGVMFVTSMLLVAAFTVANGEVQASRNSTTQKQAYYAALAGIQQYEYKLEAEPDFWQTCESIESSVPEESSERYVVTPLVAESSASKTCSKESPFSTMIQATGPWAKTFRIKSVGEVKSTANHKSKRTVVATFGVVGFLDYVYYTNYETEDPGLYKASNKSLAEKCEGKYYSQWSKEKLECPSIWFKSGDAIEGPLHTNDTSAIEGSAVFGRSGHEPKDTVEMNGGSYGPASGCPSKGGATYNTASGCYITTGPVLTPPANDESLGAYVEAENHFEGLTELELKGSEIKVNYHVENAKGEVEAKTKTLTKWPTNGLLYVQNNKKACGWSFSVQSSDTAEEKEKAVNCGWVYVKGEYEKSLTIAASGDVIVTESIYPKSVAGKLGSTPTGTAVLGLIASEYVRVYHPCSGGTNQAGSFKNPWIYAGILATSHSWIVDNSACGSSEGELNVFGAIAQDYRGIVLVGSSGYVKNYEYDDRLATDEPPYFLAPLKAGWKIDRETAPSAG